MHGLLVINKPQGLTSHDVVARVRKLMGTREVGHSGTLDPLASGLMVLLIGEATKLSQYVTEGDKSYQVGFKLGVSTDTLDITGKVLNERPVTMSPEKIRETALGLVGSLNLPIPMFSAKKIDGKKMYEYARAGDVIEQPMKLMKFWNVQNQADALAENLFHISCSKGSFIRSWVQHLGEVLGCGATMSSLVRTESHQFNLSQALTLEDLEAKTQDERVRRLVPLDQALPKVKKIRIKGQDQALLRNGQISHQLKSQLISYFNPDSDQIIQILPEEKGSLLALVGLEPGQGFRIKRVFNC